MRKWVRTSFIAITPLLLLSLFVSIWIFVLSPWISSYIKDQLPKINSKQDYARISFTEAKISLIKLQLVLSDLNIKFNPSKSNFDPITSKRITLQIDPFKLLIGQLDVSYIILEKNSWKLLEEQLPKTEKSEDLPLDLIFEYLPDIPIRRIILKETLFEFLSAKNIMSAKVDSELLVITNLKKSLLISSDNIEMLLQNKRHQPVHLLTSIEAELFDNRLKVGQFSVSTGDSKITAQTELTSFKKITSNPEGQLSIKGKVLGENLRDVYLAWFPQKSRFPTLYGKVELDGKVSFKGLDNTGGQVSITSHDISIDHFKLGNAHILVQIKNNQLQFEQVKLTHPAGLVELKNVQIEQKKPYTFQTELDLKEFNLQRLFQSLGLNNIPVDLNALGQIACLGQFIDPLFIKCRGKINTSNILVKANLKNDQPIVKLDNASLDGQAEITNAAVSFSSKINFPNSNGEASGQVDFENGFKIDFTSQQLDLNDIDDIAQLKMKGLIKIQGSTSGDSDHGEVSANITASDFEIDRFRLGYVSSKVNYKKSKLLLEDIVGKLNETSYAGQMQLNLSESNLVGLFNILHLEGEDLLYALNNRFHLPFEMYGHGRAQAEVSGPFDFWKLKYDVQAQLKQGELAKESFDQLDLHLNSNGNFIQIMQAKLKKPQGSISATGAIQASPQQLFDLRFKSSQLTIEEVDHITNLLPNLAGQLSIEGGVHGPILDPTVKSSFSGKKINFDGVDYSNTYGELSLNQKELLLKGQIMGRQIQTDLRWPWDPKEPYFIKAQIRDLSLFSFLPIISLPAPPAEYYSKINAEIDISGSQRKVESTDGFIKLNDLILLRGVHSLKLNKPSLLTFNQGIQGADILNLSGDGNSLNIKPLLKKNENTLYVEADLQLRLFQFLTPFIENLSGQVIANTTLSLNKDRIQMLGEGEISNALVKLKGFPIPIESIDTPIQFSQSKIIFEDITANLAARSIEGSGFIDVKGRKNILVDLNADGRNLEIIFPEKITTTGDANIKFSGVWLPYNLKIDYKVNSGLVEKDFTTNEEEGVKILTLSPYLPKNQIEERQATLSLDVNVDLSEGVVVKNQLVNGIARGQLNILGAPENPQIVGRIEIDKNGKLFFRDKEFVIDATTISFSRGRDINPIIYASANARVSEYDINLLAQGPAKNVQIKPTSQPPLSEPDIFSLLALGYTTHADQTLSSETQQRQAGIEALATITNQSEINKKIQNTFGLTVQLAPSIDSTKNIAVPKVVVSKQLQKNLNASYSRPLTGDSLTNEVKLQYLFNPNFSVNLNYQNTENNQQQNIQNTNINESGVFGSDLEYKLEFK